MTDVLKALEPARYLRAPVLDVPGAIALGIALLSSIDRSLSGAPHKSAKLLRSRVLELQSRWAEQRAAASISKTDPRPVDQRLDRAWAAVARRLETLSELPETVSEAKLAATLYSRLFPEGLSFLALAFEKQWAESEQRLKQLGEGPIAKQVAMLVGDYVISELRDAHVEYGRVLGITAAKAEKATASGVAEALRGVTQAIAVYALQLVAAAHADAELAPAVQKALRPLDDIRTAQSKRAAAGQAPSVPDDTIAPPPSKVDPTTPVPDV